MHQDIQARAPGIDDPLCRIRNNPNGGEEHLTRDTWQGWRRALDFAAFKKVALRRKDAGWSQSRSQGCRILGFAAAGLEPAGQ